MSVIHTGAYTKGNQTKFVVGEWFYKEDSIGYESIVEALVSELEYFIEDIQYADYYLELYNGKLCCKSKVFVTDSEIVISFYKLLMLYGVDQRYLKRYNGKDLLEFIVSEANQITELNVLKYTSRCCMLDSITLNEDRHLNNLAVIYNKNTKKFRECPIFDNGLSLLSDIRDYPMGLQSVMSYMRKVKSKPFNRDFVKQVKYFTGMGLPLLKIDYNGFLDSLSEVDNSIDDMVLFKKPEYLRSKKVLLTMLSRMEGVSWERV